MERQMNSDVYRSILSAHIQSNGEELTGPRFVVQMDNDPKRTAEAPQDIFEGKQIKYSSKPKSVS